MAHLTPAHKAKISASLKAYHRTHPHGHHNPPGKLHQITTRPTKGHKGLVTGKPVRVNGDMNSALLAMVKRGHARTGDPRLASLVRKMEGS